MIQPGPWACGLLAILVSFGAASAQLTQPGALKEGDHAPLAGVVRIGVLFPATGGNASFGKSMLNGIALATEQQSKAGILGRAIETIPADDQSRAEFVRPAVRKLIDTDKVCAILGNVSSSGTMAAAPDAQKSKIPLLTPFATRPDLTDAGDFVFRACVPDTEQGGWIAELAIDKLKLKNALIFSDPANPYSNYLVKAFTEQFTKRGGRIVSSIAFTANDENFEKPLEQARAANADFIFLPTYYSDVLKIVPAARKLGINIPFIGGDAWDAPILTEMGKEAMNGCYFVSHFAADDPGVQDFVKAFKARFAGQVPDATAALSFDAANLLFDAIRRAGSDDGSRIREALADTSFKGIMGTVTIGKDRVTRRSGAAIKIEDQKFKFFSRIGEPPPPAEPKKQ